MASQPAPFPKATPPRNKALLRAHKPLVSLNKSSPNPYFVSGGSYHFAATGNVPFQEEEHDDDDDDLDEELDDEAR